ncbi:MAG: nuclear transport factor 2 family protein [Verrucomicrobiota bacterium]
MKRISFAVPILISLATLNFAVAGEADVVSPGDAEIVAIINGLMERVSRTAETLDAEKTLAPLTRDRDAVFFFDAKPYTRGELTHCLGRLYGTLRSMSIKMDKTCVKVLGPDSAVWIACGKGQSISKSGKPSEEYLTETWVWQRKAGTWQVVHHHESVAALPSADQKRQVEKSLAKFAGKLQKRPPAPSKISGLLEAFLRKDPNLTGSAYAMCPERGNKASFYVYRSGEGFARHGTPTSYDYTTAEWYAKAAKAGKPEWSEPYYDIDGAGIFMVTCSFPIYNTQKELLGVVTADLGF